MHLVADEGAVVEGDAVRELLVCEHDISRGHAHLHLGRLRGRGWVRVRGRGRVRVRGRCRGRGREEDPPLTAWATGCS